MFYSSQAQQATPTPSDPATASDATEAATKYGQAGVGPLGPFLCRLAASAGAIPVEKELMTTQIRKVLHK
jgi:hypothetical protein